MDVESCRAVTFGVSGYDRWRLPLGARGDAIHGSSGRRWLDHWRRRRRDAAGAEQQGKERDASNAPCMGPTTPMVRLPQSRRTPSMHTHMLLGEKERQHGALATWGVSHALPYSLRNRPEEGAEYVKLSLCRISQTPERRSMF